MAVAAHTSLLSLSNLLEDVYDRIEIQYPPLDAQPFDALREGVTFLLRVVADYSQLKSLKLKILWRRIAEVAHEADDIIDAHVVYQLYKESSEEETSTEHSTFSEDMDRVNQMIDTIKTELLIAIEEGEDTQGKHEQGEDTQGKHEQGEDTQGEKKEGHETQGQGQEEERDNTQGENVQALEHLKVTSPDHASSATSSHGKDKIVVGLDEKVIKIMDQLASNEVDLRIITISGMGGIGKTTLAKTVYDNSFIDEYFDVRLWVVVSQQYVVEKVLQGLLNSGEKKYFRGLGEGEEHRDCDEGISELSGKLYKGLFGRRYLVVMDDVWSTKVWDDLKRFFPKNGNGSRIMMTTRDSIVASSVSSISNMNKMDFLDSDSSWKLLCEKAFSHGVCPNPELEEVGKSIAEGCKGLPLSIVVTGSMTRKYWESIAKDVNSFRNSGDDGLCLEILSLSYNNLPIHLKACFLCMRYYPEDYETDVQRLIREWIAEGFIQPIQHRSLESVAEEYFRTLVDRNLILVHQYYANGDLSKCRVHDLVRELCWRAYDKEHLILSPRYQHIIITSKEKMCVLCDEPCGDNEELTFPGLVIIPSSSSQVSPSMCETCALDYHHIKRMTLVKVMDIVGEYSGQELVHATKMQAIVVKIPNDLKFVSPSFAHLLWRLQRLFIIASNATTSIVLPSEIWKMRQLREIAVDNAVLTYPANADIEGNFFIILKYLHRLHNIRNFMCTPEVACRIPNLKALSIRDGDNSEVLNYSLCNLVSLHKLEELIPWKDIAVIGSLPNLEWLRLDDNAFIGPEWNPTEGEFLRLKVLEIESIDLVYWKAENMHFPKLEKLFLRHMLHELEIPSDIGDIPTLNLIHLHSCSNYVINSAKQLWEEQQDYGNEMLQVCVTDIDGRYYEFGDER